MSPGADAWTRTLRTYGQSVLPCFTSIQGAFRPSPSLTPPWPLAPTSWPSPCTLLTMRTSDSFRLLSLPAQPPCEDGMKKETHAPLPDKEEACVCLLQTFFCLNSFLSPVDRICGGGACGKWGWTGAKRRGGASGLPFLFAPSPLASKSRASGEGSQRARSGSSLPRTPAPAPDLYSISCSSPKLPKCSWAGAAQ